MKNNSRSFLTAALLFLFSLNNVPVVPGCGPSFITPVFDLTSAPEDPFQNFASGRLGIIKPEFHRVVLFAAFRYLNGGAFTADEQTALLEVWNAEFKNKDYVDDDITTAVKTWLDERKRVVPEMEKLPRIYTERSWGGYDFFPNCTRNAFETAAQTLKDRIGSYGAGDKDVMDWVAAQDLVFTNCAAGRRLPSEPSEAMHEWLRKDRAYQIAAAEFYSLNYDAAKDRFAEIAQDTDSPWQETANYLVGRTLIRKANSLKDPAQRSQAYSQAEQQLRDVVSRGGKFADSADGLLGLIKYRIHPQERVLELARELKFQAGKDKLRQNLIDYSWLLDKFEKESLEAEDTRKKLLNDQTANAKAATAGNVSDTKSIDEENEGRIKIYFYSDDASRQWTIVLPADATDDDALGEAEKVAGPLTDAMKERIRDSLQDAYRNRLNINRQPDYQGGYWGEEERSLAILPQFLRSDDLTDWLFTYQIQNADAYRYSLAKFKQNRTDLWLMTAISKAAGSSEDVGFLLEEADRTSRFSPAYPTIAFHQARILLEQKKPQAANKLIDEMLESSYDLPQSAKNQFQSLKTGLAGSLDDYLKYAQLKPFAFNYGGRNGTIQDFIDEAKSYYDPKYHEQTREDYDRLIEDQYREERPWQDRLMFDYQTIQTINQHFPLAVLIEAERSAQLPDYLRERFAVAIWTRSVLLDDFLAASKIEPELLRFKPELRDQFKFLQAAKSLNSRQRAALYIILKNPMLTPFVEDGFGRTDNQFSSFDIDDWWCAPYVPEDGEIVIAPIPYFITKLQLKASREERNKLIELGDAPAFLSTKALEWAKSAPLDDRVPEALFLAFQANGWSKYGCGGSPELRKEISDQMKKRYPKSPWTAKLTAEEDN